MTSEPGSLEPGRPAAAAPTGQETRRLHPAGIAILAIKSWGSLWFAAVAIIAGAGPAVGIPIVLALLVVIGVGVALTWRVTTYAIVDGGLRYRTGLLSRREVDVPASRISALDTTRGILQRAFGVVALEVQTAGGTGKAEVVLHAVALPEAERIRRELGHRAADATPAPAEAAPGGAVAVEGAGGASLAAEPAPAAAAASGPRFTDPRALPEEASEEVFRVSPRDLLLAGLTSPSGAVIGAFLAVLYGPAADVLDASTKRSIESSAERVVESAPIVIGVVALLVIAALSVLSTALTFYGLRVTRDERRLRVRRGLLTERTGTLPLDRVHALRIVESPLRQLLGFVAIEAEVAGWAREDDTVKTIVPFVHRRELPRLLPALIPGYAWPEVALERPPGRALRRYVVRAAAAPAVVAAALAAAPLVGAPLGWWRWIPAGAVLLAGVALGVWQFRAAGVALEERRLVLRSRGLARTTVIALVDRVQHRRVTTTPFQRRAALAHLAVALSSRRVVRLSFVDAGMARRLLAELRPRTARARAGLVRGEG